MKIILYPKNVYNGFYADDNENAIGYLLIIVYIFN